MTTLLALCRSKTLHRFATVVLGLTTAALIGCGGAGGYGEDCDGCGPGPSPNPSPSGSCVAQASPGSPLAIVPGVSQGSGFSELSEGMIVPLQFGGQGGSHVDLGARTFVEAQDVDPSALTIEFEIDGASWSETTMVQNEPCDGEWSQVTGRVFDPPSGNVMLRVSILDGNVELAMTEIPVFIQ